jgi:hypothetical protein
MVMGVIWHGDFNYGALLNVYLIPTAPASENNNPASSGWRCHRKTAAGDRVSATSPFSALGNSKRWDFWSLPWTLFYDLTAF